MIPYGIYMIWARLKGIKWSFLHKVKGEEAAWKYGQEVFRKWSNVTIKTIGMDIHIEGSENLPEETCVFMGNHQSILDIPLIRYAVSREIDFVAKEELVKTPVIGYWITHLKSVALDRNNPRAGIKAINKAIENVKEGYTFCIFPEGTRSKDGKLNEFKKGSLKIATKSKVSIIPFALKGTSACFEDNRKLLPGRVDIIFGEKIETKDLSKEEERELLMKLQGIVADLYKKII
jgi:1-acyl-sn-glycerol-3-phosphate acyltransferase